MIAEILMAPNSRTSIGNRQEKAAGDLQFAEVLTILEEKVDEQLLVDYDMTSFSQITIDDSFLLNIMKELEERADELPTYVSEELLNLSSLLAEDLLGQQGVSQKKDLMVSQINKVVQLLNTFDLLNGQQEFSLKEELAILLNQINQANKINQNNQKPNLTSDNFADSNNQDFNPPDDKANAKEAIKANIKESQQTQQTLVPSNFHNNQNIIATKEILIDKFYIPPQVQAIAATVAEIDSANSSPQSSWLGGSSGMPIKEQMMQQVRIMLSEGKSEVSFQLEPKELGRLTLNINLEKGIVIAKIAAANYQVKSLIEASLSQLRQSLDDLGLKESKLEVSVTQQFLGDGYQGQQQRFQFFKDGKKIAAKNIYEDSSVNLQQEKPILSQYSTFEFMA